MADNENYIQDDEITLKELILKIKEFWFELWKYWWLIALITLPFLSYMVYESIKSDTTYPAKLTFMVNKDDGNSLSAFSGILGSFGFGGGRGGEYNLDKMLQLLKSRKITEQVLFTSVSIEGNSDFLANHIINNLDTLNKWSRKPTILNKKPDKLKGFRFSTDSISSFDLLENTAIKRLHSKLIGNSEKPGLINSGYNEESGILNLGFNTQLEELSILLTNTYFEKLSTFYTQKSVESQQSTYDLIKAKTDSIENALNTAQFQLADLIESTRSIFSEVEKLKEQRLQREVQKLNIMYVESAKNKELADFSLKSSTPFVQLLDAPISPIAKQSESLLNALLIGGFLGVFIGCLIVITRKIYQDTMSNP